MRALDDLGLVHSEQSIEALPGVRSPNVRGVIEEAKRPEFFQLERHGRQQEAPCGRTFQVDETPTLQDPKDLVHVLDGPREVFHDMARDDPVEELIGKRQCRALQIDLLEHVPRRLAAVWRRLPVYSEMLEPSGTDPLTKPVEAEVPAPDVEDSARGGQESRKSRFRMLPHVTRATGPGRCARKAARNSTA